METSCANSRSAPSTGSFEIPIATSYRLADAAQAIGGHAGGAIVLTP